MIVLVTWMGLAAAAVWLGLVSYNIGKTGNVTNRKSTVGTLYIVADTQLPSFPRSKQLGCSGL